MVDDQDDESDSDHDNIPEQHKTAETILCNWKDPCHITDNPVILVENDETIANRIVDMSWINLKNATRSVLVRAKHVVTFGGQSIPPNALVVEIEEPQRRFPLFLGTSFLQYVLKRLKENEGDRLLLPSQPRPSTGKGCLLRICRQGFGDVDVGFRGENARIHWRSEQLAMDAGRQFEQRPLLAIEWY